MNNASNSGGSQFCGRTRREFLWETGGGFTATALAGMLGSVAASLSAGVMLAVTVFAVSYWERRWYFTRIGVQEAA